MSLSILIVEDDEQVRRLMARTCVRAGYAVLEAASAERGLQLYCAQSTLPALAIIDMVMPSVSGLDLAVALERLRPGQRILYVSGYVDSIAMESIARRSPERVLLKPFTEPVLMERVQRLLGPDRIKPARAKHASHRGPIERMG